ncbi:hypothetical protein TNCV_259431 [Trichonephila clavipes]|uniref:Uncharacterized protein n=1 Tax=Trichonephila clavipes TaxID=2585209 RepID=A0A8X6RYU9_TRICX|nr:hypothetical protein TNCV_259431 [Trichonephila clavipes]
MVTTACRNSKVAGSCSIESEIYNDDADNASSIGQNPTTGSRIWTNWVQKIRFICEYEEEYNSTNKKNAGSCYHVQHSS